MPDVQDMAERHSAALKRVAEVAERLAMKHAGRALETDDPKVEASATASFQKATRVMRQCMALEAKLLRNAEQGVRDQIRRDDWALVTGTETRKRQLKTTVERLIRSAADPGDEERLCDELDDLVEAEAEAESFLTEDLTLLVTRLCKALDLKGLEILAVLPHGASDPPQPQSSA